MPTKKTGLSAPKAPGAKVQNKPTLVTVSSDLRKLHPWFDKQSTGVLEEEQKKQRVRLKKGRLKFSAPRIEQIVLSHARIQEKINRLERIQKRLTDRIKGHYGHTGAPEIESLAGRTLISISASYGLDKEQLWNRLTEDERKKHFVTVVVPVPKSLLEAADENPYLRAAIEWSTAVSELKVSVIAPDSRRGKSGNPEGE